jgi:hypothetical protein
LVLLGTGAGRIVGTDEVVEILVSDHQIGRVAAVLGEITEQVVPVTFRGE